jgi:hypothetical protein
MPSAAAYVGQLEPVILHTTVEDADSLLNSRRYIFSDLR